MTLSLIVNPAAGGGRAGRELPGVKKRLTQLGLEHHVHLTDGLDHARALAHDARSRGETAVAFGGDGLIGAVADALKRSDAVLGVLPGGRGNDFARALGIPREPGQACEVLANGVVRRLDLGFVRPAEGGEERTFIGIASCGFDSEANRIANDTRIVRGNLVYAYGAIRALIGWRPATFEVALAGPNSRTLSHTGYTVAAANSNAYGGGMLLAPDASLEDGLLDVVLVGQAPKRTFIRLLPTVFKGTHVRHPSVEVTRASSLEIRSERRFMMYADGDPIGELPVRVGVLPGAINVLAPDTR